MKRNDPLSYCLFLLGCGVAVLIFPGCEQSAAKRHYTEIFIEPEKQTDAFSANPHAFMEMMPQDDIHRNLGKSDMEAMPSDSDPHAFLPQMPQDDIHKNLSSPDMALQQHLSDSVAQIPLRWTSPKGWTEKEGSGMRLATLVNNDKKQPVEISIVSLGGVAGGLENNVARWMQQIQLEVPNSQELTDFIKQQERFSISGNLPVTLIDLTERQTDKDSGAPSMIAAVIDKKDAQIFVKMTGSKQAVIQTLDIFKTFVKSIQIDSPQ